MYPTANEKIIISRRVPCRLQTRRIKKFHNSRLSPCGQQPPRRRAAVQITPAPQSPPLPPKRLATPAIAGKLMAWTAPLAPARWKPRSVRCPGSVRSRCCSPQKSCWLTPRAMSALRLRTRSARRGIRCAMPMLPQQSKPEGRCCATICRY